MSVEAHELRVVVTDDGCGYLKPTRRPGLGMGLTVISDACDDFTITERADGGTEARMRFLIGVEPAEAAAPRRRPPRRSTAAGGRDVADAEPFRVDADPAADRYTVRPVGELDLSTAGRLTDALAIAGRSGAELVVLDLTGLTFIDSSGVRVIVQAVRDSRAPVAIACACGPPELPNIQGIFELLGIDVLLPLV